MNDMTRSIISIYLELSPTSDNVTAMLTRLGEEANMVQGIRHIFAGGSVVSDLKAEDDGLYFNVFVTEDDRCQGLGSGFMKYLVDMADEYKVTLYGIVEPFGRDQPLSIDKLQEWYSSFGFDIENENKIRRVPKP